MRKGVGLVIFDLDCAKETQSGEKSRAKWQHQLLPALSNGDSLWENQSWVHQQPQTPTL